MLVNSSLTVYHKVEVDHDYKWVRYFYKNIWWFGGKGSSTNKGYDNANDVEIRIPYDLNKNLDITKFSIGDILVKGSYGDITSENDLNILYYNITAINDNVFGNNKNIHISGK